ncbi:trypsin-like peptidase domain-containing protein [bacterium]|nr:trypsin-like peptidase domain-containing protein [bacterium]
MRSGKILSITLLACASGLLLGFAFTTLEQRRAEAQSIGFQDPLNPSVGFSLNGAQREVIVAAQSTVGVGGSFVSDVYEAVSPAVVHITNRSVINNWPFGTFESEKSGSGVIVKEDGYILTNNHLVAGAQEIYVVLYDGREFSAEVIGADPGTDLALIKIDSPDKLPVAILGDSSKLKVGEWVVAIGNPRGLDWTVTVGVVSALGREIVSATGQTIRGLIQTDASINPGNSGGPLLNAAGQVIGINDAIVSSSGGSEGIGLAIPINTAKDVLDDLVKHGRVIRPWLGIIVEKVVTPRLARQYNLPVDYGVWVKNVYDKSPASRAVILPYIRDRARRHIRFDIIVAVDDQRIDGERTLLDIIREHEPGDTVDVELYRIVDGEYEVLRLQADLTPLPAQAPLWGVI